MTPDFSLDDIADGAGQLDALCHCVNSASFLPCDVRKDAQVHLVLDDEYTVRFEGPELRQLGPGGCSAAALIRRALEKHKKAIGHMPAESSLGASICRMGFEATLEEAANDATMVELYEDGNSVIQVEPPENPLLILSNHHDFTDEEIKLLMAVADERVRLGPKTLHTDHPIMVTHSHLDTVSYSRY